MRLRQGFSDIRDGRWGIVDRNGMLSTLDGEAGHRGRQTISFDLCGMALAFFVIIREAVPLFFSIISMPVSLSNAICLLLLGRKGSPESSPCLLWRS